ncbi:MAG: DUF4838 domain-containing protein [Lachnospiraceae bacterium]|nr:DUF4838 domain-containing protein [Lachnospiraceae bacterium]
MKIITMQRGDTFEYAASELKKYIMELSRGRILPELCQVDILPDKQEKDTIVLGLLEELLLDANDLNDPFIEDIIDVDVKDCTGYIGGSNPRSVLMGVYKYCTSAGCRFIRPGVDGEYIPHADLYNHSFRLRKKADYPFRGECCEGAISYEHMRDTVYWMPKVGMNMYMIEGIVPYTYMHKWYGHIGNTKLRQKGQVTDNEMLTEYIRLLEQDIKKVGLQLHTLGHGWMFRKLGVENGPSEEQQAALREGDKKYLALIKGKRELYGGSSFYTHFCYSNPEARKILVDTIVEYIQEKPYMDFVHVWLADAPNNQCECENCVKMQPSDHYVQFLNELDEALEAMESKTRIAFIGYVETERPPQKLTLYNSGRFVFLSAIGLHYEKGYKKITEAPLAEEPEYKVNNFHPAPDTVRMKWRMDWKKACNNIPNVIFEYRFYTDMYCDLGHMQISRETYRDMRDLADVGFEGCMNDQTHRMYMPTSLPLITMGETLFDRKLNFDKLAEDYFEGAFGTDGNLCRVYLEKLSELLCPSNFRVGGSSGVEEAALGDIETQAMCWMNNKEVSEKAARIPAHLAEFLPVIDRNIALATDPARLLSWRYLKYHSKICSYFAELLLAGAEGRKEETEEKYYKLEDYLSEHELEFHHGFDVQLYLRALRLKLGMKLVTYYD